MNFIPRGFGFGGTFERQTQESERERPLLWALDLVGIGALVAALVLVEALMFGRALLDLAALALAALSLLWFLGYAIPGMAWADRLQVALLPYNNGLRNRKRVLALLAWVSAWVAWLLWLRPTVLASFWLPVQRQLVLVNGRWYIRWWLPTVRVLGVNIAAQTFDLAAWWLLVRVFVMVALPLIVNLPVRAVYGRGLLEIMAPSLANAIGTKGGPEFEPFRFPWPLGWIGGKPAAPAVEPPLGVEISTIDPNTGHTEYAPETRDLTVTQWEALREIDRRGETWAQNRPTPDGFTQNEWRKLQRRLLKIGALVKAGNEVAASPGWHAFLEDKEYLRNGGRLPDGDGGGE